MAHILIADDDDMVAGMASEVLIEQGHACGWVTDAEQALDLLHWKRPDLLLLDQDMPGITGGQLLRKMRTSPQLYDLPVIMFTAMTGANDEQQARYHGAQDYIRKPFDPRFLIWRVNQVLATRRERPQHEDLQTFMARRAGEIRRDPTVRRAVC